jgi:capsular polysaccharide biosynthesis protein
MNLRSFIFLIRKFWKQFIVLTVISALTFTLSVYFYQQSAFNVTVFINIGAKSFSTENKIESNLYDTVQAADQFTETIQGWFKNPAFINRIDFATQTETSFSVRKQEKQNLIVTFRTPTEELAKKVSQSIQENLRMELGNYNRQTSSNFELGLYDTHIKKDRFNPILFPLLGLLLGVMLAMGLIWFYEYLFNPAHNKHQAG